MHKLLWRTWGIYFNYPKCCVESFCTINKEDRYFGVEGDPFYQSGFVPCKSCYEKTKNMSQNEAEKELRINIDRKVYSARDLFKNTLTTTKGPKFKKIAKDVGLDYNEYIVCLEREYNRLKSNKGE